MKKISLFITSGIIFFLLSGTTYATPTISSEVNQTFDKNQISTQLRNITITEDSVTNYIKSGVIKLTIPDSLPIIFDDERTLDNMVVYGTAVDNGKVLASPVFSFENKDKTLIIPIEAAFAPGEVLVLTKVFVEGFNTVPAKSGNMFLQVNEDVTAYTDAKYLRVQSSTNSDHYKPEPPTNIVVKDDVGGVKISWINPTDLDIQTIQILKGLNNDSISANNPILVGGGEEEYIDTAVVKGDTVKYILRANDGLNTSDNSAEISFIVGTGSTEPAAEVTPPPVEEQPTEEVLPTEEVPADNPPSEEAQYCSGYKDIPANDLHCNALTYVTAQGIFKGYADGTFKPDQEINRAETVKVIVEGFEVTLAEDDHTNGGFSDTVIGEWYMPYLQTAKQKNIIRGYLDGTFKPQQTVSYVEMLKIFLETSGIDLPAEKAGDVWYKQYVDYALLKNLVPYENITAGMKRVDVAELFYQWSLL